MTKFIYRLRHIESKLFVKIRLTSDGADVWHSKNVISGKAVGYGKVLFKKTKGWSTPPPLTEEDLQKIGCEIVRYRIEEIEE